MDEEQVETNVPTVGERVREAREAQKMNLEDIAAQTRIPLRHLESIEAGDWAALPAPTYTVGFAKSYAGAVGLDRTEIGDQLREEMGGQRSTATTSEVFEPADPARTMPKWLVLGAIAAVIVIVLLMSWLSRRSLSGSDEPANVAAAAPIAPPPPAAPAPAAAQGEVILNASEPVWLSIYDNAGTKYFEGTLGAGQAFTVPATASAPLLKTGKPEALQINVGNAVAPPVGPAGKMVSDVSLLPADLMRGGQPSSAPATISPAPAAPPAAPRPRPRPSAPTAAPTPPPPATAPAIPTNPNG